MHKALKGSVFAVCDSTESAKKSVEIPGQNYKNRFANTFQETLLGKNKKEGGLLFVPDPIISCCLTIKLMSISTFLKKIKKTIH